MEILLELFKTLNTILKEDPSENIQTYKCSYCKKRISGYIYLCLECFEHTLCNECYSRKNCNESHSPGHKILRLDGPSNNKFGKQFEKHQFNLEHFEKEFENELHKEFKCKICNVEPIKGLRFKCSECFDFNLCSKCKDKTTQNHLISHSLITHGKTFSNEINLDKLNIENKLGEGAFGEVYKATYDNKKVACKIISASKSKINKTVSSDRYSQLLKSYKRELNGYNEIQGDNILRMLGQYTQQNQNDYKFYLLTELMTKGSLNSLIQNEPDLTNRKRFKIATGIASGMAVIHKIGYIHRDIRPDNILISHDYEPKIGDMGIARIYDGEDQRTLIGCLNYMPPEFYTGNYDKSLDVFTFGLTLNELFKGNHNLVRMKRKIEIIKQGEMIYHKLISNYIDDEPNYRPNSKQIVEMLQFINEYINKAIDECKDYFSNKFDTNKRNKLFEKYFIEAYDSYGEKSITKSKEEKKKRNQKLLKYFLDKLKYELCFENFEQDSDLLYIYERISSIYSNYLEDAENSTKYVDFLVETTKKIFKSEDHLEMTKCFARLGYIHLILLKNFKKAKEHYEKALNIINNNFNDDDNPYKAHYNYRIGCCLFEMNEIDESIEYHSKSLAMRRSIYDTNSSYLLYSLEALMNCFSKKEDKSEYLKYRRQILKIKRNLFAIKHPNKEHKDVFLVRGKDSGKSAWHYVLIENEEKYEELQKQKAGTNIDVEDYGKVIRSGWGEEPSAFVRSQIEEAFSFEYQEFKRFKVNRENVNPYFYSDENDDPVLKFLFQTLKMNFELYNDEYNEEVLECLLKIADYFYDIKDSYNCNLYADKCLEIAARLFPNIKINRFYADCLNLKACCEMFYSKNDLQKALKSFKEVLDIRIKLYGNENNPKVSSSYLKVGQCLAKLNEFKEALKYFHKCLDIRKIIYNQNQPNIYFKYILDEIQDCYKKDGDIDNYLKYRKQLLQVKEKLFKFKHPNKEYKDVFLVRGKDSGKPAWHYVLIENEEKYEELHKQKAGTNIDVADYGKVIRSGWGVNPSNKIQEEIDDEYGVF
jgi:serine/threonine protein kinase